MADCVSSGGFHILVVLLTCTARKKIGRIIALHLSQTPWWKSWHTGREAAFEFVQVTILLSGGKFMHDGGSKSIYLIYVLNEILFGILLYFIVGGRMRSCSYILTHPRTTMTPFFDFLTNVLRRCVQRC